MHLRKCLYQTRALAEPSTPPLVSSTSKIFAAAKAKARCGVRWSITDLDWSSGGTQCISVPKSSHGEWVGRWKTFWSLWRLAAGAWRRSMEVPCSVAAFISPAQKKEPHLLVDWFSLMIYPCYRLSSAGRDGLLKQLWNEDITLEFDWSIVSSSSGVVLRTFRDASSCKSLLV